jgi:ankyrin repeat protein
MMVAIRRAVMHRLMLFVGMGTALLAANACVARATRPLAAAAARNDGSAIRRLLTEGAPVDETDEHGWTALMWASRVGALDAMTALLDAGADANGRDTRHRWTPLLHAIHTLRSAAVRLLLERGADPNLASPGGVTPLLMAADDPDPTSVQLLLAHGANPRHEGPGGVTPLTQAVSGGALTDVTDRPLLGGCHPATVRAFLEHDPSLKIPETFAGRQALWWARFHDCSEVLKLVDASRAGSAEQAIRGIGLVREKMSVIGGQSTAPVGPTPPDDPRRTPATDARSRR